MEKLPEVGYSYFLDNIQHRERGTRIHVRAIVDDFQIVYCWYGLHKQWWHYGLMSIYDWQSWSERNKITKKQKSKVR